MSLLTALWVLPLGGAAACLAAGRRGARWAALAFSCGSLALALLALRAGGGEVSGAPGSFGVSYSLFADGLSLSLILLTAFLNLICVAASWEADAPAAYWAAFQGLASALTGVFLARDLFLFYVFFEATLIPMFFIIGLWGSENRRHAALKFFLFTFAGSILMLLALLAIVAASPTPSGSWTWDVRALSGEGLGAAAPWALAGLLAGFAVKIPIVPLHTWLPDAHTEAPAAGSVMLAGVMLKMGLYGIMRVAIPLFPQLSASWMPALAALAAVNAVYGALCAMAQSDLKRLIAYSSIAHLGFCVLGVASGTSEGVVGGSLQMLNHGITTGALFLLVGFLYERAHTREIAGFGELAARAPWMAFFFGFSVLASIGLPGLNGFVGEFMALSGIARSSLPVFAVAGGVGVTLAAAYSLPAFQAVFWGPAGPATPKVDDLNAREKGVLWTLCAVMLWMGLQPGPWLALLEPATRGLVRIP